MEITVGSSFDAMDRMVVWFNPSKILCSCRKKDRFRLRVLKLFCRLLFGWRYIDDEGRPSFGIVTDSEWTEST